MLLVVPPVALGAVAYGRRVRKLSRDVQDALAGANEVAEESIVGHPHGALVRRRGERGPPLRAKR